MWTSFHSSDQSKHGCTKPYKDWRTLNIERSCVKRPPKTQGILELHHKSTKHMVLSSYKERIDNLVIEPAEWKEAKREAYTVQTSRSGLKNVKKEEHGKTSKAGKRNLAAKKKKENLSKAPDFTNMINLKREEALLLITLKRTLRKI